MSPSSRTRSARTGASYRDPLRFDIRRNPKHIMTFGAGSRFCAGSILARRILARTLVMFKTRFPDTQLVDPSYEPTCE